MKSKENYIKLKYSIIYLVKLIAIYDDQGKQKYALKKVFNAPKISIKTIFYALKKCKTKHQIYIYVRKILILDNIYRGKVLQLPVVK